MCPHHAYPLYSTGLSPSLISPLPAARLPLPRHPRLSSLLPRPWLPKALAPTGCKSLQPPHIPLELRPDAPSPDFNPSQHQSPGLPLFFPTSFPCFPPGTLHSTAALLLPVPLSPPLARPLPAPHVAAPAPAPPRPMSQNDGTPEPRREGSSGSRPVQAGRGQRQNRPHPNRSRQLHHPALSPSSRHSPCLSQVPGS